MTSCTAAPATTACAATAGRPGLRRRRRRLRLRRRGRRRRPRRRRRRPRLRRRRRRPALRRRRRRHLVSIGGGQNDQNTGGNGLDSVWLDAESTEIDNNGFFDALFEGAAGTHHRVAGFQGVTNGSASQTPSRELNGQNLLDPATKGGVPYSNFSDRPLFGSGGPSKDDIEQGNLADCYFLAGLSAVAKTNALASRRAWWTWATGRTPCSSSTAERVLRVDGDLPA